MHTLEPYYYWRNLYIADEDERSPFYGRQYSEFEFTHHIYDHYIHPQWDYIGSGTLFIKILYVDYETGYAIIEMIGEWNDCLYNDIMTLKRNIIDELTYQGVSKFILIGENVLNFHGSDDCYYEEWFDEIEDGWIAMLNFREHVLKELKRENIDQYLVVGGLLEDINWRTILPVQLFQKINLIVSRRIGCTL